MKPAIRFESYEMSQMVFRFSLSFLHACCCWASLTRFLTSQVAFECKAGSTDRRPAWTLHFLVQSLLLYSSLPACLGYTTTTVEQPIIGPCIHDRPKRSVTTSFKCFQLGYGLIDTTALWWLRPLSGICLGFFSVISFRQTIETLRHNEMTNYGVIKFLKLCRTIITHYTCI